MKRKSLLLISSILFFLNGLSGQEKIYYADTISMSSFDSPIAIELSESDSMLFTDVISGIIEKPLPYRIQGDTLLYQWNGSERICTFRSDSHDTLNCNYLGKNLSLKRSSDLTFLQRPQEPRPPFPYESREVKFKSSGDSIFLSGTLSLPQMESSKVPCVVLVSGSGPQNRNSMLMNHKPFLVIADHLAKRGIATLRYDDRGVGKSEGVFTDATVYSFVNDAMGAIEYLRKHENFSSIGLLGHSEGGMVASEVCTMKNGADFYVLVGSPAVSIDSLLLDQAERIMVANESSEQTIEATLRFNSQVLKLIGKSIPMDSLSDYLDPLIDEYVNSLDSTERAKPENNRDRLYFKTAQQFYGNYLNSFINFPVKNNFREMSSPTLAIYGGKDLQVSAELNEDAMRKLLNIAPVDDYEVISYPDFNHLMQSTESGSPSEYVYIPTTIEEVVLEKIVDWINHLR